MTTRPPDNESLIEILHLVPVNQMEVKYGLKVSFQLI